MLDLKLLKEKPQEIQHAFRKRMIDVDLTEVLELDTQRRTLIQETETLKAQRNSVSAQIPRLKKDGQPIDALKTEMQEVSAKIKQLDAALADIERQIKEIVERLPNIPDADVPAGGKENNQVVHVWGQKTSI